MKPILFVVGLESSGTRWLSRSIHKCIDTNSKWDGEFPACKSTSNMDIFHVSLPWGGWCTKSVPRLYYTKGCAHFQKTQPKHRWILDIPKTLSFPNAKAVIIRRHPHDQFASKMRVHCKNKTVGKQENEKGNDLIIQGIQNFRRQIIVLDYEYMDDKWQWLELTKWLNLSCPTPSFKLATRRNVK